MLWALLPFFFIALVFGFTEVERDLASVKPPATPSAWGAAAAAGQVFLSYRQAVVNYMQAPSQPFDQPLNNAALPLTSGVFNALPQTAMAVVTRGPSSNNAAGFEYTTCLWMPVPAGTVGQVVSQLGGDLTIGTVVANNQWVQIGAGGTSLPIPSPCLASLGGSVAPRVGDIISVFTVGTL